MATFWTNIGKRQQSGLGSNEQALRAYAVVKPSDSKSITTTTILRTLEVTRTFRPGAKPMKKRIWLLPLLIILGAMLVTVEMKSQSNEVLIQYDYGNLVDTSGRIHSVRLVFHPDGSVTWRDLTPHIR
jgi:hypothetical protein